MLFLGKIFQWISKYRGFLWNWSSIVLTTYFIAKTANLLMAHFYLPLKLPDSTVQWAKKDPLEQRLSQPATDISVILSRNIFDSEAHMGRGLRGEDQEIHPSTLNAELLGTIVFTNHRFSVALIRDGNSGKSAYYGIGEPILSARILKIERFKVIIDNQGQWESLEIKNARSQITASSALKTPLFPEPSRELRGGDIEEIEPNRFVIPQSILDETLSNFSQVLTQARMVPNLTSDNKTNGFRVFQIKPGSIYSKLKLENDDIIKRVNGQDLNSFEKATGLFTALRNEKIISIDLERDGKRIQYAYEIR